MSLITISNVETFDKLINGQKYVLVDFHAVWCGPCKMMKPHVEKIAKSNGNLAVATVDVDQVEALAERYKISSLPTFLMFYNGTAVKKIVGANPAVLTQTVAEILEKP